MRAIASYCPLFPAILNMSFFAREICRLFCPFCEGRGTSLLLWKSRRKTAPHRESFAYRCTSNNNNNENRPNKTHFCVLNKDIVHLAEVSPYPPASHRALQSRCAAPVFKNLQMKSKTLPAVHWNLSFQDLLHTLIIKQCVIFKE